MDLRDNGANDKKGTLTGYLSMSGKANTMSITAINAATSMATTAHGEVRRSVVSAQLLTRLAAGHGIDPGECLEGTGIDRDALADPRTAITAAQEMRLVANLVRYLGHLPGIGLDAGLRYHLSSYGIWGFALISSPTFRSAVEVALRYLDLTYAFVRFSIEERGDDFMLVLDDSHLPDGVRQFLLERDFGAWVNAHREMAPQGLPVRGVRFRFSRPAYSQRFADLCGVEPRFDAPDTRIVFSRRDAESPQPQGDPLLARVLEAQCRSLLDRRRMRDGIAGQVRDRLLHSVSELPALDDIARELCMAPRSLRRRLQAEGVSYRMLVDEVRQALAEEMLASTDMKLDEIAVRLGYAETASFIRSFRRWKGVSPGGYRQQASQQRVGPS